MGELIAFLSGKGGTGKTSLCAGIATALASMGQSVLCIDCDVGLRNLDIALGLSDACAPSFLEVCRGEYTLDDAVRHPIYETLSFLTAPVDSRGGKVDRAEFSALLRKARSRYRYIFLDAPAGIDAGFRLCAFYADRVMLVTNPDASAVRDAAHAGRLLEQMGKNDVRMILNRVNEKLFNIMNITVDDVMDDTALPVIGIVPDDPDVTLAAAFDQPLLRYTDRGAAGACRRIAKRIQGVPVPLSLR